MISAVRWVWSLRQAGTSRAACDGKRLSIARAGKERASSEAGTLRMSLLNQ